MFEAHQALLNALSSKLFYVSEKVGDGARTKLVNNLLAGINLVGAAEVMVMAQKMGLNLEKTLDVMEQSSAQSWIASDRMRRALTGDYAKPSTSCGASVGQSITVRPGIRFDTNPPTPSAPNSTAWLCAASTTHTIFTIECIASCAGSM